MALHGPQADIDGFTGQNYEEGGRTVFALHGEVTYIATRCNTHGRSGILLWFGDFARYLTRIAAEQSLRGFQLELIRGPAAQEILNFCPP